MVTIITAVLGNLVCQPDCDAVVNSANLNLRAGSGVCGAIYRAAGPELEPCSIQLAPLPLAHAVVTPGFRLPNRLIIHCRGPRYLFDPEPAANLALCLENTLLLAEQEQVTRIAVPAISMGVYAYPPEEAAPILVNTASRLAPNFQHLGEVRFVVVSEALLALLLTAIQRISVESAMHQNAGSQATRHSEEKGK